MEIRFKDKQEENIFIGCIIVLVIALSAVLVSVVYSILKLI